MSKYDPRKQYTWMNDERFVISGRDLGLFMNAFRSILNTEEAARILLAQRTMEAIDGIVAEYVEKDVIKEVKPQQPTMKVEKGDNDEKENK